MTQPVTSQTGVFVHPPASLPIARQYSGLGEGLGGRAVSVSPTASATIARLPAVFERSISPSSPPRAARAPMDLMSSGSGDKRGRSPDGDERGLTVAAAPINLTADRADGRASPTSALGLFDPPPLEGRRTRARIDATPGTALALAFGDMPLATAAMEGSTTAPLPRNVTVVSRSAVSGDVSIARQLVFTQLASAAAPQASVAPESHLERVASLASSLALLPHQSASLPLTVASVGSAEASQLLLGGSMTTTATLEVRTQILEFSETSLPSLEEGEVREFPASGTTGVVPSSRSEV